jgi:hypothetical protein
MSTSGSIDFIQNRNQLITTAYALINVYQPDDTIPSVDMQYGSTLLNMMVKSWESQDIHLWTKTEATLFLELNQAQYTFPGANATNSYVETTLSADEASGQTTLSVTSSSGMSVNDNIGIILDSGELQWTTISVIPNSTSVTVADALTDDASSGNNVYTYTTAIDRPLRILSCRRNSDDDQDTPMFNYAYEDYFNLPNKTSSGIPTTWTYNPQRSTGILYIWPTPSDLTDKVNFTYLRSIQDLDQAINDPDFPQEWLEVITYQLAVRLSHRYGKRNQIRSLKEDADVMLASLLAYDNEPASIYLQPSRY